MESKEDIIRKYIKGIVSIESNGKVMYVSTKNCFARTSTLEFLKKEIKLQRNISRNKSQRWFINVCN